MRANIQLAMHGQVTAAPHRSPTESGTKLPKYGRASLNRPAHPWRASSSASNAKQSHPRRSPPEAILELLHV